VISVISDWQRPKFFYVRFMHNCVAYTDLDKIMSDIRKCAPFDFFRFIFRFRPKMSCIVIFILFFGRKRKKNHFWSTSNGKRRPIYDFLLVINTNLPPTAVSYTVSKLWVIIGQIFASESGVSHLTLSLGWSPANIAISDIPLKLDSLAYISAARSIGVSSTTFT